MKRFRTRQEHIYHSEDMFSDKKQHCKWGSSESIE